MRREILNRMSGRHDSPEPAPSSTDFNEEVAFAYAPIVRGFLAPASIYYTFITIAHYFSETTGNFLVLGGLSLATAAAALYFRSVTLAGSPGFHRLEVTNLVMNLLIYINIITYLSIHFEEAKLVYFVLLILIVAGSGVSPRVIISSAAVSLVTMLWLAYHAGGEVFLQFAFMALAGGFTAFGMAWLMRGAILRTTRARLAAEELRRKAQIQADYDPMTGLPNRRRFFCELSELIKACDEGADGFHLGIVDLDGFKPVNDLYGHAVGDALLVAAGHRLADIGAGFHLLARLGGDEFAVLVRGMLGDEELLRRGRAICEALSRPFLIEGIAINVSGSVGFACCPRDGRSVREIYERADHALYQAKRVSRGDVVVFDANHEAELGNISRVDQTLRVSDLEKELFVMFQPQHDVVTGRVIGFEALARWQSPTLGLVPPSIFIAAAERSDAIGKMTGILLRKALASMVDWPEDVDLSFNLSARDLLSEKSIENICAIVAASPIAPARLTFEITETSVMTDFERARGALDRLHGLGCLIALDDFGSGYSNFSYVHRFPLHQLKTDRSFVTRLSEGGTGLEIMKAIVELCRNLRVDCLVEGVETEAELKALTSAGARYMQGYYFSKPMLPGAVCDYLSTRRNEARQSA